MYDAQDLQKKVEYCEQMTPIVRPVFTVYDENAMVFVAAEIPPVDVADPVSYTHLDVYKRQHVIKANINYKSLIV